jgi:hypothetical protein
MEVASSVDHFDVQFCGKDFHDGKHLQAAIAQLMICFKASPKSEGISFSASTLLLTDVPDCHFQLGCELVYFLG